MGTLHKAIINEYGTQIYDEWRKSRMQWAEFEQKARLYRPIKTGWLSQKYRMYL